MKWNIEIIIGYQQILGSIFVNKLKQNIWYITVSKYKNFDIIWVREHVVWRLVVHVFSMLQIFLFIDYFSCLKVSEWEPVILHRHLGLKVYILLCCICIVWLLSHWHKCNISISSTNHSSVKLFMSYPKFWFS